MAGAPDATFFSSSLFRSVTLPLAVLSVFLCRILFVSLAFFSALSRRNFQRKHGTEFQVFNGPMENRFGSDAVAGNLFRDVLRLFVCIYILAVATEMVENCIPVDYMIFYHYPFHGAMLDYVHATFTRNYAFHVFNCTLSLSLYLSVF